MRRRSTRLFDSHQYAFCLLHFLVLLPLFALIFLFSFLFFFFSSKKKAAQARPGQARHGINTQRCRSSSQLKSERQRKWERQHNDSEARQRHGQRL
jgi:hypothetical protein